MSTTWNYCPPTPDTAAPADLRCRPTAPRTLAAPEPCPADQAAVVGPVGCTKAPADICDAADRDHAEHTLRSFAELVGAKSAKAVAQVVEDAGQPLACYAVPAERGRHLTTSNPISVNRPARRRLAGAA